MAVTAEEVKDEDENDPAIRYVQGKPSRSLRSADGFAQARQVHWR
jgi:ABC-type taurine transport system ATPase subunit